MQPLDVSVFQLYKHWHDVAIKDVIASLDVEYGLRSFLRDLAWIRQQTFKKSTIRHAFRKAGMYPPNATACLEQLRTFNPPKEKKDTTNLSTLPRTPTKPMEVEVHLTKWEAKFTTVCSSPSRPEWESFVKGTKTVLTWFELQSSELRILQERRKEELEKKAMSRKVLRKFGGLTAKDAQQKLDAIAQKESEKEMKNQKRARDKILRDEKNEMYRQGVEAREQERLRKRKVKELTKAKQDIPPELLVPIPDPEKIWKAGQLELEKQLQEQLQREDEVEATFILDPTGDQSLTQDYIAFPPVDSNCDDSSSSESGESELYDSDKDYSWFGRYK